jgi:hypothetical protein
VVTFGGNDAGFVHPPFDEFAGVDGLAKQFASVRSESAEQHQVLGAVDHVDGVELDEAQIVDGSPHMAPIDASGRPGPRQPVGPHCESACCLSTDVASGHRQLSECSGKDCHGHTNHDVADRAAVEL